ncbi:MAG: hypothetical protein H7230_04070 [Candidatus Parcubacteria bacterium]|nr:hypothetical protein [Candidatus Paceibacterota bacterium]
MDTFLKTAYLPDWASNEGKLAQPGEIDPKTAHHIDCLPTAVEELQPQDSQWVIFRVAIPFILGAYENSGSDDYECREYDGSQ